jgi:zinc transport system ATP-binding protein
MNVIEAEGVTFAYEERPVVEDVSLAVEEGEFVGLIGPNGSGKTTLLKLVLGLQRPDSGTVRLFGEPTDEFVDGERLGYVSQKSTEADRAMPITVREVVTMGRYPHAGLRRLREEDREIVESALDRVGISDLADRRINRLSGGQKQRAYIARALASEADLLALDEPTVGVDADSRDRFYDLLNELNGRGITIVLIEHDIGVVTEHVDTVVCINRELLHHGSPETFAGSDALARAYGLDGADSRLPVRNRTA